MAESSSSNSTQNHPHADGYYDPDRCSSRKPKPTHNRGKDRYYDGVFIKKKCDCCCLTDWSKVLKCNKKCDDVVVVIDRGDAVDQKYRPYISDTTQRAYTWFFGNHIEMVDECTDDILFKLILEFSWAVDPIPLTPPFLLVNQEDFKDAGFEILNETFSGRPVLEYPPGVGTFRFEFDIKAKAKAKSDFDFVFQIPDGTPLPAPPQAKQNVRIELKCGQAEINDNPQSYNAPPP